MIRVGIEGIPAGALTGGVGTYIAGLAREVPRIAPDVGMELLVPWKLRERLPGARTAPLDLDSARRLAGLPADGRARYDLSHALCRWVDPLLPPLDLLYPRLDLFHGASLYVPPFLRLPAVVTVHDLAFLKLPGTGTPGLPLDRRHIERWMRRCRRIIAVSRSTARDLHELFGEPESRVVVVPNGFDPQPFATPCRDDEAMRLALGIDSPYLLHVGTVEPRKNHRTLLAIIRRLRRDGRELRLVLVGRPGWRSADVQQEIRRAEAAGDVRWLDRADDRAVAALYRGAEAFLFPSLYEGFGYPVLEAMAAGTPVVCTDNSSLPEVAGGAALRVADPRNAVGFAAAVERLLDDPPLRAGCVARGQAQAERFPWSEAAAGTARVYREASQ